MAADVQSMVPIDVLVAVIAVVNITVQALVQVVSHLISKSKAENGSEVLDKILAAIESLHDQRDTESHMIRDLYEMHKVADSDGRPIWYFPGSVTDLIKQVSDSQANIARILETIVRQLDRRTR